MDVLKLREEFPILQKDVAGKPLVYLDSACMTLRPKCVIEAITDYYTNFPACGGRSVHKLATEVTIRFDEAREKMKGFLNAEMDEEIVFTKNTTEAMNIVANSYHLGKGDTVLTTDREHNSNAVPWHEQVRKRRITYKVVESNPDNTFDMEGFKEMMSRNVKLVSMVHTSNLEGYTIPAKEIIEVAHDYGAKVMLDAAQSAPHKPLDVKDLDVDFLGLSVHKMCGPAGVGVLYGKYDLLEELEPYMVGGSTVEDSSYKGAKFLKPPQKFEAGLQNYGGAVGTSAAVDFINSVGKEDIMENETKLNRIVTDELKDVEEVSLIGPEDPSLRGGIYSFNISGLDSHDIAMIMDEVSNIMIRSGMHCVHGWFNAHGIRGSARASFYLYNTVEEAKFFAESVKKVVEQFS